MMPYAVCRFVGSCPKAAPNSWTCQYGGGENYYGPGRPAGCYRDMAKKEEEKSDD